MNGSLEEKILSEVKQEIEAIIADVKEEAEETNNTSAINILIKVNKKVEAWCEEVSGLLNVDNDEIQEIIECAKETITLEAKNKVAADIAEIVIDGKGNVIEKISEYTNELKRKGIDFNLESKEEKKSHQKNLSLARKKNIFIPPETPEIKTRSYRSNEPDCSDYGCSGGSSGCGGGGC